MELRLTFLDLSVFPPHPMLAPQEAIYCLGNFDGVHLAHQAILREGVLISRARLQGGLCGVFCFFQPSSDFRPGAGGITTGAHLTTLREKLSLCAMLGVDFACLCDFRDIRDLSPADFCALLLDRCGCRGTVCGFNYRFGAGGAGRPQMLHDIFNVPTMAGARVLPETVVDGMTVSSTRIRQALTGVYDNAKNSDGVPDIPLSTRLLGRPYALEGIVHHGKRLGHTLGFPTANQFFPAERLIPAHGVYAARAHTAQGTFPAVSNIGIRPTVDGNSRQLANCETHIIGFDGDLYGQLLSVEFLSFIRKENKFSSLDDLKIAIARDTAVAQNMLEGRL